MKRPPGNFYCADMSREQAEDIAGDRPIKPFAPLNGCMCQDGTCESCNRVMEAFEAMRGALTYSEAVGLMPWATEHERQNAQTHARAALALAAKARP